MAVVLRAFDMDMDFDLLSLFERLSQEDLALVRRGVRESLPPEGQEITLLQKLLQAPSIPEHKITLNDIVKRATREGMVYGQYGQEGAVTMYRILSYLWDKIGSNGGQNSGNTPDLPPQNR